MISDQLLVIFWLGEETRGFGPLFFFFFFEIRLDHWCKGKGPWGLSIFSLSLFLCPSHKDDEWGLRTHGLSWAIRLLLFGLSANAVLACTSIWAVAQYRSDGLLHPWAWSGPTRQYSLLSIIIIRALAEPTYQVIMFVLAENANHAWRHAPRPRGQSCRDISSALLSQHHMTDKRKAVFSSSIWGPSLQFLKLFSSQKKKALETDALGPCAPAKPCRCSV
jgi:hypothetical protein